jgi:hypothetical protein
MPFKVFGYLVVDRIWWCMLTSKVYAKCVFSSALFCRKRVRYMTEMLSVVSAPDVLSESRLCSVRINHGFQKGKKG